MPIFSRRHQLKYWLSVGLSLIGGNLLSFVSAAAGSTPPIVVEPESFELEEYLELLDSLDPGSNNIPAQTAGLVATPSSIIEPNPLPAAPLPPKILPSDRVRPSTTNWIFNGTPVNHFSSQELTFGNESGSNRNSTQSVNGVINLAGKTTEQTDRNGVYSLDYRGTFGQIQTLRQSRQVTTDVTQPSTMIGFRERLTLTGDCTLPNTPATSQCSYLPGLVTDRTSLDANQQPTRINQPSQFGDVVTPASLAAMRQPGFQPGAEGQILGTDLYFPNAGIQAGNGQSTTTIASRREEIQQTPAIALGRIHQTIVVNDREAAIGRTIRGNAYIQGDRNLAISAGLQLATEALPEAIPTLPAATSTRSPTINRNLFKAPDLARIPENSFSLYHYGIARATHAANLVTTLTQIPPATYQGWWIGLSPVIARTQATRSTIQLTGAQQIVNDVGQEGGIGDNVNIQSRVNGISFDARQLQNVYQQAYITVYNQDVTLFTNSKLTETTHYSPHFSYTGNITNSDAIFRYYAGGLVQTASGINIDRVNAYAGLDYTKITDHGLTYGLGGMMYTSPDPEYHSYAIGSISQKLTLSPKHSLTLSGNINYIADGQVTIDRTLFQSANSSISLGAIANLDRISLGISQAFASPLPNSTQTTLATSLAVKLTDNLSISGYWTPINQNPIRSPYGISANLRLGNQPNSPSLTLGWSHNTTEFGRDSLDRSIQQHDRLFTVILRLK
jgi:hypothetical protein